MTPPHTHTLSLSLSLPLSLSRARSLTHSLSHTHTHYRDFPTKIASDALVVTHGAVLVALLFWVKARRLLESRQPGLECGGQQGLGHQAVDGEVVAPKLVY